MNISPCIGLIMSGAYVNQELSAEFGLLPPAFLPLGVGRLYDMQIEILRHRLPDAAVLYMTVPESFNVPSHDLRRLNDNGIQLVEVPDRLELGEALVYAINIINAYDRGVCILHGDTVIDDLPSGLDVVAGQVERDDYSWARIDHVQGRIRSLETIGVGEENSEDWPVACGYFAFSSGGELVRSICQAGGHFIDGLNRYAQRQALALICVENWYDFGHIQTYFRSRRLVTTARAFNALQITRDTVRKLSTDAFKMKAEAQWLAQAPLAVRPYVVRLLDQGIQDERAYYTTEYQYVPNLSELYVFSSIGRRTWKKILNSCAEFLNLCVVTTAEQPRDKYTHQLMAGKTIQRLERFAQKSNFDIDQPLFYNGLPMPSLVQMAHNLQAMISDDPAAPSSLMHGDFCFSNILYNSRNTRVLVVDPRGYVFDGKCEIYGDIRYDIAKYSHSIHGLYDFIMAGRYDLAVSGGNDFHLEFASSTQREWVQDAFAEMMIAGVSPVSSDIQAMMISLFISMLPLHADRPDRQMAFIANALRLYAGLEGRI